MKKAIVAMSFALGLALAGCSNSTIPEASVEEAQQGMDATMSTDMPATIEGEGSAASSNAAPATTE